MFLTILTADTRSQERGPNHANDNLLDEDLSPQKDKPFEQTWSHVAGDIATR